MALASTGVLSSPWDESSFFFRFSVSLSHNFNIFIGLLRGLVIFTAMWFARNLSSFKKKSVQRHEKGERLQRKPYHYSWIHCSRCLCVCAGIVWSVTASAKSHTEIESITNSSYRLENFIFFILSLSLSLSSATRQWSWFQHQLTAFDSCKFKCKFL